MKTVILKWNPSFSSYTMRSFLNDMRGISGKWCVFNWSVWDHDKIHEGDEFYWLKVGYGQTGIVGHGRIVSEPYEGEDWSGKGRQTFYVDFIPDIMICPDAFKLLDSASLTEVIPDFEWTGGHSGLVLADEQAAKLDKVWREYIETNQQAFVRAKPDNLATRNMTFDVSK